MTVTTFFRLVLTNPPARVDFQSHAARGRIPMRDDAETVRLWNGVSVYDSLPRARKRAMVYPMLGDYIAEIALSSDDDVIQERTTTTRGHYTLWGSADLLLARVVRVVAVSEPRDDQ